MNIDVYCYDKWDIVWSLCYNGQFKYKRQNSCVAPVFDLMWLSLLVITENTGDVYFIIQIIPY